MFIFYVEDSEKQLKERKAAKEVGIQFDYIIPSMGKRYIAIIIPFVL